MLTLTIAILSCNNEKKQDVEKPIFDTDNAELIDLYLSDQNDRNVHDINWMDVNKRDSLRRLQVEEINNNNGLKTARDYKNAAMIFLHGKDSTDYKKAIQWMKEAIALDSTINKWPFAAATDSYLLSKGEPQIYGTQYYKMENKSWKVALIDTTKVSDAERIKYGVETLKQQIQKVLSLNNENHSFDDGHGH